MNYVYLFWIVFALSTNAMDFSSTDDQIMEDATQGLKRKNNPGQNDDSNQAKRFKKDETELEVKRYSRTKIIEALNEQTDLGFIAQEFNFDSVEELCGYVKKLFCFLSLEGKTYFNANCVSTNKCLDTARSTCENFGSIDADLKYDFMNFLNVLFGESIPPQPSINAESLFTRFKTYLFQEWYATYCKIVESGERKRYLNPPSYFLMKHKEFLSLLQPYHSKKDQLTEEEFTKFLERYFRLTQEKFLTQIRDMYFLNQLSPAYLTFCFNSVSKK